MKHLSILRIAAAAALLTGAGLQLVSAQAPRTLPGRQSTGEWLVPTNQVVTPIGTVQRVEGARPKDLALSPDGHTLAVLATNRVLFYGADSTPAGEVRLTAGALGIAWAPDGQTVYASGASIVYRLARRAGEWTRDGDFKIDAPEGEDARRGRRPANPQPNGLAVSPDARRLYVALGIRNAVAVVDTATMHVADTVQVGVAPYRVKLSPDGRMLVAANRGGEHPDEDDETEPSAGTPVRVDPDTDAARRGSLSIIDTATLETEELPVGRQPSGMAVSADGRTLYVANSDEDTVSVVDLHARRVRRTINLEPREDPGFGQIPTDVALAPDEKTLYVACGGANAVAVVDLEKRPRVSGYMPAGWFPIAMAQRGGTLFVASSKGLGSQQTHPLPRFSVFDIIGTVQFISAEGRTDLERDTRQVASNNHWGAEAHARRADPVPVPLRAGEPSVFKHIVYIIKENHTYDSTLGDMPEGNGDPKLTIFGEEVTPNQHALARQFVLLDNLYSSGTNSADGHQWTDSAVANGYMEQNYSAHSRSYPYDGGDPLAYSPEGFLWTAARKRGLGVRVYGEFVNKPHVTDPATGKSPSWAQLWQDYQAGTHRYEIRAESDSKALRPLLHPRYIGFPLTVSDQWRASQFLADLAKWERTGEMPALCMLELPNDHTSGTRPGMPTPRAQVADNDLAVGRLVEALSHSRFWRDTLILIVEDDSQLGIDHVDGHRTIGFCVSPYTRRGAVVGEFYNHTSLVRTIELVLGLPPMTHFDRTATSLAECFTSQPDFTPYTRLPNRIPLDEMNPPASALRGEARRWAEASLRLDLSDVDRADATVVARAVWHSRRPGQPFPWAQFHPNRDDD